MFLAVRSTTKPFPVSFPFLSAPFPSVLFLLFPSLPFLSFLLPFRSVPSLSFSFHRLPFPSCIRIATTRAIRATAPAPTPSHDGRYYAQPRRATDPRPPNTAHHGGTPPRRPATAPKTDPPTPTPGITRCCACQQKMHATKTQSCACQEEVRLVLEPLLLTTTRTVTYPLVADPFQYI